ncbi:ly-6/neurotoxin-like protein 1 isoform X1 [Macaca thibetana thibetana]|uniref:ly-6/neurotoxin-like protein 1 isoform X1 n=1 Tax=Macaca thibetana thibetana TaxID=257877 RepID=UPI0021BC4DC1|nr:ly-6/neurotoxin-like protein 1 isoform X1 [Macaca thibetana thibetana]
MTPLLTLFLVVLMGLPLAPVQALDCHVCAYNGDNCFNPMRCPAMVAYCMTTRTCDLVHNSETLKEVERGRKKQRGPRWICRAFLLVLCPTTLGGLCSSSSLGSRGGPESASSSQDLLLSGPSPALRSLPDRRVDRTTWAARETRGSPPVDSPASFRPAPSFICILRSKGW